MQTHFLIVGAGIIGLTVALHLKKKYPHKSILIIEKESTIAQHASGRNSGVLHAGLYYANDSMRARYCRLGAEKIKTYCLEKNIPLNSCGKVVVTTKDEECEDLQQLYQRAIQNGVRVDWLNEQQLAEIEPTAKTIQHAIYSPETASFDAIKICQSLKDDLTTMGVKFQFNMLFFPKINIEYDYLVNCAGCYADKIAQSYGLAENYTLIPFKGIFLYVDDLKNQCSRHIYPLPDKKLKLLGAHFSPEYDGKIKIGPTAMPCLSRENYTWLSNLHFNEMKEILFAEWNLFYHNTFNFRQLALQELQKQTQKGLMKYAAKLVKDINQFKPTHWGKPGILPRLYDLKKQEIVDDFIIKKTPNSIHVINSVSPAFTASFAFSEYIVSQI